MNRGLLGVGIEMVDGIKIRRLLNPLLGGKMRDGLKSILLVQTKRPDILLVDIQLEVVT